MEMEEEHSQESHQEDVNVDHEGLYSLRRMIQCICRRGRRYIETGIQT